MSLRTTVASASLALLGGLAVASPLAAQIGSPGGAASGQMISPGGRGATGGPGIVPVPREEDLPVTERDPSARRLEREEDTSTDLGTGDGSTADDLGEGDESTFEDLGTDDSR